MSTPVNCCGPSGRCYWTYNCPYNTTPQPVRYNITGATFGIGSSSMNYCRHPTSFASLQASGPGGQLLGQSGNYMFRM